MPRELPPGYDPDTAEQRELRNLYNKWIRRDDETRQAHSNYALWTRTVARPRTATTAPVKGAYPAGRVASLPSTRRLQALVAIGHNPCDLATRTELPVNQIWFLLTSPRDSVSEGTASVIDWVYDLLCHTPNTGDDALTVDARQLARQYGWCGPYGWNKIDTDARPTHASPQAEIAALRAQLAAQGLEHQREIRALENQLALADEQLRLEYEDATR